MPVEEVANRVNSTLEKYPVNKESSVDYLLCSFTDFLLCFRCISELIRIYTELFDRTFFIYTELFCVHTVGLYGETWFRFTQNARAYREATQFPAR